MATLNESTVKVERLCDLIAVFALLSSSHANSTVCNSNRFQPFFKKKETCMKWTCTSKCPPSQRLHIARWCRMSFILRSFHRKMSQLWWTKLESIWRICFEWQVHKRPTSLAEIQLQKLISLIFLTIYPDAIEMTLKDNSTFNSSNFTPKTRTFRRYWAEFLVYRCTPEISIRFENMEQLKLKPFWELLSWGGKTNEMTALSQVPRPYYFKNSWSFQRFRSC